MSVAWAPQFQRALIVARRSGFGDGVLVMPSVLDCQATLAEHNARFIDAFRVGSWARLEPLIADDFQYLDGATGEVWTMERYIADVDGHPTPTIEYDQLVVHVAGEVAVVSARTYSRPGAANRYVDTYRHRDGQWQCVQACVWPIQVNDGVVG